MRRFKKVPAFVLRRAESLLGKAAQVQLIEVEHQSHGRPAARTVAGYVYWAVSESTKQYSTVVWGVGRTPLSAVCDAEIQRALCVPLYKMNPVQEGKDFLWETNKV